MDLAKDSESPTSITTGGAGLDTFGVCGEVLNLFNNLTEPSLWYTLPKTPVVVLEQWEKQNRYFRFFPRG